MRRPRGPRLPSAPEAVEQAALFAWAEIASGRTPELAELFATMNGARVSMRTAVKMKAQGNKAGIEDVLLLVARGGWHGLLIELKRTDAVPSDTKPAQRAWHATHTRRGYRVEVCKGWEAARVVLLAYLALPPTVVVHPKQALARSVLQA